MKKYIALLLALAVALCLCACDKDSVPPTGGKKPSESPAPEKTLEEKLLGTWDCINHDTENNLCLELNDAAWMVSGDVVTVTETKENGTTETEEYKLHCLDGWYIMVGQYKTYAQVAYDKNDPLLFTTIQITADNWQEYFELGSYTFTQFDAFGDPVGEYVSYHLRLKAEYLQRLLFDESEVTMRYAQQKKNGQTTITDLLCTTRGTSGNDFFYYGIYVEDPAEYSFEMVRVQGSICLVNIN